VSSQDQSQRQRRRVLKGLGAAGITGLAGCTGGGGGQETETTTPTTKQTNEQQDFSDVTFTYWNIVNIQNRNARDLSNQIIKEFEKETGATVNVNFSGYDALVGAKWRTAWENDNYPVLYDNLTYLGGHLNHKVVPVSEYIDKFDDQLIERYQWVLDLMAEHTYRGYAGSGLDRVYEIPFGLDVREPNIFRKDHFEQAGVSWEDNMPPESYDQLVDTMKTVMNEGPANTGYQAYGAVHDWSDVQVLPWQIANAGIDGMYVGEEAKEPNFDKQNWIDTYRQYVNLYKEHGLCGQKTPQMSDEETVPNIISGNWSGGSMDPFNHPSLTRQAPDLANSGKVQYTPQFKTDNLEKGGFIWSTVGLAMTQKPPQANQSKWERKQEAAIALMQKFLEKDLQRQSWKGFGTVPARKDVWSELERKPHGLLEVLLSMAEETDYSVSARPGIGNIYSTLTGPTAQKALRGDISVEEACNQIAEDARNLIQESPFPSER
jgi:ABC-type glycerol-3-phosphate transport system substrate-binding protein